MLVSSSAHRRQRAKRAWHRTFVRLYEVAAATLADHHSVGMGWKSWNNSREYAVCQSCKDWLYLDRFRSEFCQCGAHWSKRDLARAATCQGQRNPPSWGGDGAGKGGGKGGQGSGKGKGKGAWGKGKGAGGVGWFAGASTSRDKDKEVAEQLFGQLAALQKKGVKIDGLESVKIQVAEPTAAETAQAASKDFHATLQKQDAAQAKARRLAAEITALQTKLKSKQESMAKIQEELDELFQEVIAKGKRFDAVAKAGIRKEEAKGGEAQEAADSVAGRRKRPVRKRKASNDGGSESDFSEDKMEVQCVDDLQAALVGAVGSLEATDGDVTMDVGSMDGDTFRKLLSAESFEAHLQKYLGSIWGKSKATSANAWLAGKGGKGGGQDQGTQDPQELSTQQSGRPRWADEAPDSVLDPDQWFGDEGQWDDEEWHNPPSADTAYGPGKMADFLEGGGYAAAAIEANRKKHEQLLKVAMQAQEGDEESDV